MQKVSIQKVTIDYSKFSELSAIVDNGRVIAIDSFKLKKDMSLEGLIHLFMEGITVTYTNHVYEDGSQELVPYSTV